MLPILLLHLELQPLYCYSAANTTNAAKAIAPLLLQYCQYYSYSHSYSYSPFTATVLQTLLLKLLYCYSATNATATAT